MKTFAPLCLHPDDLPALYAANATYKHPALSEIPDISAVYILRHPDGSYYVGSTIHLRARLQAWVYKCPHSLFNYFTVKPHELRRAEEKMIRRLRSRGIPLENIHAAKLLRRPPQPKPDPKSLRQRALRAGVPPAAAYCRVRDGKPFNKKRPRYKQWVTINGRNRPVVFWSRWYKIPLDNITSRRRIGWSWQEAITTPVGEKR